MNKLLTLPPLGLYIHFPWCEKKCPYCDFNSHTIRAPIDEERYVNNLLNDLRSQVPWAQQRHINTLFLGGGTPSLFSADALNRLLNGIQQIIPITPNAEITMEANPGSLSPTYLQQLQQTAINRLSIGVQSFHQTHLTTLGRIHNPKQAHQAIEAACNAGFSRINVDLMYGLPNQTPQQAITDIETALNYPIEHLSWYQLTIEPNTYFYKHPPKQPDHDDLYTIQQQGQQRIAELNLQQYEISAYQKNKQACRHNINYWQFGDYLGIGAGAHGKITDQTQNSIFRYWNIKHPKHYLKASNPYQSEIKTITKEELPGEFMMNALRLIEPITFNSFEESTGLNRATIMKKISQIQQKGLVTHDNTHITLTKLGRQFADDVVIAFL